MRGRPRDAGTRHARAAPSPRSPRPGCAAPRSRLHGRRHRGWPAHHVSLFWAARAAPDRPHLPVCSVCGARGRLGGEAQPPRAAFPLFRHEISRLEGRGPEDWRGTTGVMLARRAGVVLTRQRHRPPVGAVRRPPPRPRSKVVGGSCHRGSRRAVGAPCPHGTPPSTPWKASVRGLLSDNRAIPRLSFGAVAPRRCALARPRTRAHACVRVCGGFASVWTPRRGRSPATNGRIRCLAARTSQKRAKAHARVCVRAVQRLVAASRRRAGDPSPPTSWLARRRLRAALSTHVVLLPRGHHRGTPPHRRARCVPCIWQMVAVSGGDGAPGRPHHDDWPTPSGLNGRAHIFRRCASHTSRPPPQRQTGNDLHGFRPRGLATLQPRLNFKTRNVDRVRIRCQVLPSSRAHRAPPPRASSSSRTSRPC